MSNNSLLVIKISLIILLLGCLFDMPYGYFQLVRFLGMVGFGILAYSEYQKNQNWFVFWLASAIFINPIFKIYVGRTIWNIVDVVWIITLLFYAIKLMQNKSNEESHG